MQLRRNAKRWVGFFVLSAVFVLLFTANSAASPRDKKKVLAQAHYMMGLFYENQEKLEEALAEYKEALRFEKGVSNIHLRAASILIRRGQTAKAILELEEAKKYGPEDLEAGLILALLYATENSSDKAAKEYEEVLKKAAHQEPKNKDILKSLAGLYYQQKKTDKTIETYKLILSIDKNDYEVMLLLGSLLEEAGKRQEAIEKFKEALSLNPEYPDALNSLGYVYAEEEIKLIEAEELIKKALLLEPDNGAYVDSLGWVYFKMDLIDRAVEYLEKASSLLSDPVIYDHLGDAYFKKGANNKAVSNWEKSLSIDATQEKVKEKLNKLKK